MILQDKSNQQIPEVKFKIIENGIWKELTTDDLFKNKTVIVHSLPGAATPTCSTEHLPRYDELYQVFKDNGVDDIICISVNDTFVMNAWKKDLEVKNVKLIPDGNGEFTKKMGMLVDKSELGFGLRSWRYSMLVKNKIIIKMFIEPNEPGDPFKVSDADTILKYINKEAILPKAFSMITREGCNFCFKAKELLDSKNIFYTEIKKENGVNSIALRGITGNKTYPQLFIEGQLIGGYEDILVYFSKK
jgi:peroxiredoxin/glutaredoxin